MITNGDRFAVAILRRPEQPQLGGLDGFQIEPRDPVERLLHTHLADRAIRLEDGFHSTDPWILARMASLV